MEQDDRYKTINRKFKGLMQCADAGYYNKKRKDIRMDEEWKPKKKSN